MVYIYKYMYIYVKFLSAIPNSTTFDENKKKISSVLRRPGSGHGQPGGGGWASAAAAGLGRGGVHGGGGVGRGAPAADRMGEGGVLIRRQGSRGRWRPQRGRDGVTGGSDELGADWLEPT